MPPRKPKNKHIHFNSDSLSPPAKSLKNEPEVLQAYAFINILYREFTKIKLNELAKDTETAVKEY